jgi:tRNA nucleotidyltransferase (CCA-adding enzyme)
MIDLEKYYFGRERDALNLFPEPLITVDPVDQNRNAAAAVSKDTLWNFVSASRLILKKPTLNFFYPKLFKPTKQRLKEELNEYHGHLIAIDIGEVDAIVDVMWSQLLKTERILKTLLKKRGFKVIRSDAWSNENNYAVILIQLKSIELPHTFKHTGPPVELSESSELFITNYVERSDTIAGPWIEGDRWFVEKKRKERLAVKVLEKTLRNENLSIRIPSRISESLTKGFNILLNKEILTLYKIPGAAEEIHRFIMGRAIWLEAAK